MGFIKTQSLRTVRNVFAWNELVIRLFQLLVEYKAKNFHQPEGALMNVNTARLHLLTIINCFCLAEIEGRQKFFGLRFHLKHM